MSPENRTDLLEARAERGTHRGAEAVWREANAAAFRAAPQSGPRPSSTMWFRLAMGGCVLALMGVAGLVLDAKGLDDDRPVETQPRTDLTEDADTGQTPRRIVIDGMDMTRVSPPANPDFAGDDDFLDRFSDRVTISETPLDGQSVERVIFANVEDPFANPILGIDLLDGGGFRPWGINLDGTSLDRLTESVTRADGEWTVDETSGLTEVARISETPYDSLRYGWQFDFRSGSDTGTWQAEIHDGSGLWTWMARLAGVGGGGDVGVGVDRPTFTLRPIKVLGHTGVAIERSFVSDGDGAASAGVYWVDDLFVYRLTAGRVDGNTASIADATSLTSSLRIVDEETWDRQVSKANPWGLVQGVLMIIDVVVLLLWLATIIYLIVRGPRLLVAWGVVAYGFWAFYAVGPVVTIALAGGLLAMWWWIWHSGQQNSEQQQGAEQAHPDAERPQ